MMFKWIYLINHNSLDMGIRITYKTFFSCIENNENQENGNKKGNSRVKLQFKQYKSIKWKYKVKKNNAACVALCLQCIEYEKQRIIKTIQENYDMFVLFFPKAEKNNRKF